MGGLVARSDIELPEAILGTKTIRNRVYHLLMMGTPNNGFTADEIAGFNKASRIYPELADMQAPLLNGQLNIVSADKPKVDCDYYMLVGTCSWKPNLFQQGLKGLADRREGTHDGLVDVDSAGYDLSAFCHSYKKVELSVNHNYIKSGPVSDDNCKGANQSVFDVIDKWMIENKWFDAGVQPQNPQIASNTPPNESTIVSKVVHYTGGMPILLGLTYKQVAAQMGRVPDGTGIAAGIFRWIYRHSPSN
jgi:hypothetical protein